MAIDELVPNKDRGVANVLLWTLCLPFATFAPVIGRAMVGQTGPGWRGVYYLMIALSGASTLLFYVFYHPPTFELLHKGSRKTLSAVVRMIDFGGIFLLTAGLVLFLLGVSWGGQQYDNFASRSTHQLTIFADIHGSLDKLSDASLRVWSCWSYSCCTVRMTTLLCSGYDIWITFG